jgi:predicted ATPase
LRIESLEFHDHAIEWWLRELHFSDLTLLVGISGVGKTMILDAIWRLKMIAAGKPANGVSWSARFSTDGGDEYVWSGKYELTETHGGALWLQQLGYDDEGEKHRLAYEILLRNGKKLVDRQWGEIRLNGAATPKLSPFESVVSLLKEEDTVGPAADGFNRIIRSEASKDDERYGLVSASEFDKLWEGGAALETILTTDMPTRLKAALAFRHHSGLFSQIKDRFIEVFEQVEDVRFEVPATGKPHMWHEYPFLQIKERGVDDWIWFHNISAGMLKTFTHISEMYLWPKGTVVLIDEFENSLGINCIDVLTEELQQGKGLQFIITSHHPYIINSISPKHWKIVTRKGNVVSAHNISDLHINPSSRQKAFLQLVNLEEYREGIQSA